jgi:Protein of unknown function (DUF1579)
MLTRRSCALAASVILTGTLLGAERLEFHDRLLDNLVGDWHVERKLGSGRTAENALHAEWVLGHEFLELHYRDLATPPKYEAMVFIGYDAGEQRYVCHWIDNFGGEFSALGYGRVDNEGRTIEFTFNYKDGPFKNKFSFDSATNTWTSLMRQMDKGEWRLFAEDKFTHLGQKK